jgi:hypothetical protein
MVIHGVTLFWEFREFIPHWGQDVQQDGGSDLEMK